jgi:hypothetical protein
MLQLDLPCQSWLPKLVAKVGCVALVLAVLQKAITDSSREIQASSTFGMALPSQIA